LHFEALEECEAGIDAGLAALEDVEVAIVAEVNGDVLDFAGGNEFEEDDFAAGPSPLFEW
jgi:hypothetical protein